MINAATVDESVAAEEGEVGDRNGRQSCSGRSLLVASGAPARSRNRTRGFSTMNRNPPRCRSRVSWSSVHAGFLVNERDLLSTDLASAGVPWVPVRSTGAALGWPATMAAELRRETTAG
ncbi:hypothetical protein TIFTF001_009326 [Ficus carica]|uniref:Uncharacterized protein n=1 Tax=Ficus carica TaxID=3494 RepID=A0AA87ZWA3_FICCA|nr:hypothetical protein TIFTF001_009326 [Ficus carica]